MSEIRQAIVALALMVLALAVSGWMTRHYITLFSLLLIVGCGVTPEHTGGMGWK